MDYHKLLVEHLDLVERLIGYVARRHHLSRADTDELASFVRFRLIDHDFAILRKFQGRSNLSTYLTSVIEHLYLDFCVAKWGKWRPSAAARRLGPLAILLDRLVTHEGLTFDETVATLEINHGWTGTPDELRAILVQLPARTGWRPAEEKFAVATARLGVRDTALERDDDLEIVERVEKALTRALADLSQREQLLVKLRFQDGLSIAAMAGLLHEGQKAVIRQLHATVRVLRRHLRQQDIDAKDVDRIVGHPALTLGRLLEEAREKSGEPDDGSV